MSTPTVAVHFLRQLRLPELQRFADLVGPELFSEINKNWAGCPLRSYETIVK